MLSIEVLSKPRVKFPCLPFSATNWTCHGFLLGDFCQRMFSTWEFTVGQFLGDRFSPAHKLWERTNDHRYVCHEPFGTYQLISASSCTTKNLHMKHGCVVRLCKRHKIQTQYRFMVPLKILSHASCKIWRNRRSRHVMLGLLSSPCALISWI